jgi:hypothetical protein
MASRELIAFRAAVVRVPHLLVALLAFAAAAATGRARRAPDERLELLRLHEPERLHRHERKLLKVADAPRHLRTVLGGRSRH